MRRTEEYTDNGSAVVCSPVQIVDMHQCLLHMTFVCDNAFCVLHNATFDSADANAVKQFLSTCVLHVFVWL